MGWMTIYKIDCFEVIHLTPSYDIPSPPPWHLSSFHGRLRYEICSHVEPKGGWPRGKCSVESFTPRKILLLQISCVPDSSRWVWIQRPDLCQRSLHEGMSTQFKLIWCSHESKDLDNISFQFQKIPSEDDHCQKDLRKLEVNAKKLLCLSLTTDFQIRQSFNDCSLQQTPMRQGFTPACRVSKASKPKMGSKALV